MLSSLRRDRFRLLAPDWYERKYGIPSADAARHYGSEGYRLGYAPTALFDVEWYEALYGGGEGPPLIAFERRPTSQRPNRWLDPATLVAAGVAEEDVLDRLAAAQIDIRDPRAIEPEAVAVVREWPGRRSVVRGEPVTILAHYDPAGAGPAFLDQVDAFVSAGREVVVCSTSLDDADVSQPLLERVVTVLRVPNTGLDWGSYQAGIRYLLDRFDPASVLLANDSVYVLPDRLGPFLDRLDALRVDVAGATDSTQLTSHLQSYLVQLPARVLEGPLGREFLTTYVPIASKELVIHSYELGFSRRAAEHGLRIGAVHPVMVLMDTALKSSAATPSVLRRIAEGTAVGPTLHLWRPLLDDGFPFVKRQLIRDGIASLDDLRPYVPARTLALAEADVRRRGGGDVGRIGSG
jgi:hypothetical protein